MDAKVAGSIPEITYRILLESSESNYRAGIGKKCSQHPLPHREEVVKSNAQHPLPKTGESAKKLRKEL